MISNNYLREYGIYSVKFLSFKAHESSADRMWGSNFAHEAFFGQNVLIAFASMPNKAMIE
jgi:hypothetical protein